IGMGFILSFERQLRHGEIKIIHMSDTGFVIGRNKRVGENTVFVPWANIRSIESKFNSNGKPGGERIDLHISTTDNIIYVLTWTNAFAWTSPELFFSRVRANAPHAKFDVGKDELQIRSHDRRYTNLWLQYFSSPQSRQRSSTLSAGDALNDGQYTILSKIGGGGQGITYLAKPNLSDPIGNERLSSENTEVVVLKEFILPTHRGTVLEEKTQVYLHREAEILASIDHPQIVRLIDCFVEDHRGYLVLEHVPGETMRQLVSREGPLLEPIVLAVANSMADILTYLHGLNPPLIHRDLSPDNLMLRPDGVVKLVDFAVAHKLEPDRIATVVGKQAYIPPEQFRGNPVPASDIYALGCTMFYLLTGEDPEPMMSSEPRKFVPSVSEEMNAIVFKATAFDINDRYERASELKNDLMSQVKAGVENWH
ncbi:MAG: serine/threonine protein kinase, partial [Cyanobacteria bacterium]|nr:serine/threonine protein kinase [Cyanobacteriota bacterium]